MSALKLIMNYYQNCEEKSAQGMTYNKKTEFIEPFGLIFKGFTMGTLFPF